MRIYVDLVFFLNFAFDFLLLMSVSLILKRNTKLSRIILGSLIGALSIFLLFIKVNSITLFFLKVLISIVMLLSTFSYKSFKYFLQNFIYLYMSSILLGGFLYFLNIQFSYKNEGLIFFHNGLSVNFILLLIFGPLILYTYIRQCRSMKLHVSNFHQVDFYLEDGTILNLNGYLDTGNKLYDPYSRRPIVLVYSSKINFNYEKGILVPFTTLKDKGLIKCIKIPKMIIDKKKIVKDVLVGKSEEIFKIDGIDCILHSEYMEGLE